MVQFSSVEETVMSTAKEKMTEIIRSQPDDATYEEILRELAFERMIDRGLADARQGRTLPDEEIKQRIRTWQK
jgi:predicted transcriptional regulator